MPTNTYDEFPYRCLIRPDIQPNQLATLAALFNLQPPPVETCRVLELGCGNGINLIATAQSLPQADCWGVDYSERQIAEGQKIIEAINLPNITLNQVDILDIDDTWGLFDYIIIHGVYSWVAEPVSEQLLSICQHHLVPNGVAYISYNTYPGWHLNNVIRDMMQYYHVQQFSNPSIRPLETKQFLQLVIDLNQPNSSAYSLLLREQLDRLLEKDGDNYLHHDLLETDNQPVYFYQLIERAQQQGLKYITDVKFRDFLLKESTQLAMNQLFEGDFLIQEQYMDFFFKRKLRMSLFCHQAIEVNRTLDPQLLYNFYIAATPRLQPLSPPSAQHSQAAIYFQTHHAQPVAINNPLTQTALIYLITIYPHNVLFADLFDQAYAQVSTPLTVHSIPELKQTLATELLSLYCTEVIALNIHSTPSLTTTINNYPTVSPLARWQASQGQTTIVNLLGQLGKLDELTCQLLPHFNGQNNRQTLLSIMAELVKQQNLTVILHDQEVLFNQLSMLESQNILNLYLDETLQTIARNALLI